MAFPIFTFIQLVNYVEELALTSFALTVLKRRVMDHFRSDFRAWTIELSADFYESDSQVAEHSANEPDTRFELTRTAHELIRILAKLPDTDRLLMEELALGGRDTPLTPAERQRISRLRRQLLKYLQKKLGRDPIELLKHL